MIRIFTKFISNILFVLMLFFISKKFFNIDNFIQIVTIYVFSATWGKVDEYMFPTEVIK